MDIEKVIAREVLDSRGKPTIEVDTDCEELDPVVVEVDPTKKNDSNQ